MRHATRKQVFTLLVAVGVIAGGWWGGATWMQVRAKAKAVAIMPAMPEPASMPPALATKIEAAMAGVKSGDRTGLIELAALYAANGWDESARRCLQGLRQLDPKNPRWAPDADPWEGNLYQWCYEPERLMDEAAALIAADDKAGAGLRLERALMLDPTNGSVHWKAALASEAMRDQVQALAHYEQAVEYDGTLADAWLRLATLQRAIGETSKAWQTLVQGVKANPEAAALLLARGSAYAEREQFDRALVDFRQVVVLRPDDPAGYLECGRVLFALGRKVEAASTLERALEVLPEHPVVLVTLAVMAISTKDQDSADRWLARIDAAATVPAQDRAQLAGVYRQTFSTEAPIAPLP